MPHREDENDGGHVIVGSFGADGPPRRSDLDGARYAADALHEEFSARFKRVQHFEETHRTPRGGEQQFVWCVFRLDG